MAYMISAKNYTHQFIANQQDWAINAWCRKLKITRKKIESHPRIQDVALLLDFDPYHVVMNTKDLDIWTHCWKWVYTKELALTKHHKRQLLNIIDGIEYRQQLLQKTKQDYQARVLKRQKIKERFKKKQQKLAAV